MLASQWLAVHFITEKSLRMQGRGHIERLVIIVGAFHRYVARRSVRPNHRQEVGKACAGEAADYVPTFDAHMTRVLSDLRKTLDLGQRVVPGLLHRSANSQVPLGEIDSRILDVVAIDGKLIEGREFRICERGREMSGTKHL